MDWIGGCSQNTGYVGAIMAVKFARAKSMIWSRKKLTTPPSLSSLNPWVSWLLWLSWPPSGSHIRLVLLPCSACSDLRFPKIASYNPPCLGPFPASKIASDAHLIASAAELKKKKKKIRSRLHRLYDCASYIATGERRTEKFLRD